MCRTECKNYADKTLNNIIKVMKYEDEEKEKRITIIDRFIFITMILYHSYWGGKKVLFTNEFLNRVFKMLRIKLDAYTF